MRWCWRKNGRQLTWRIVGTAHCGQWPTAYVDYDTYSHAMRRIGHATSVKNITDRHDVAYQDEMAARVVNYLESAVFVSAAAAPRKARACLKRIPSTSWSGFSF
ncbi:MAG: hypothetical protein R3E31_05085 [Chloroflexota bacterium]